MTFCLIDDGSRAQHPLAGPWAAGRRCPHSLACLGLAAPVSNLSMLAIWLQLQS